MAVKEKLQEYALIAEIVGGIAIVASLVFVGVQIQQNTNVVRGATLQAITQQSMDLVIAGLEHPEIRQAFSVAQLKPDELTVDQKQALDWYFSAKLRADENRYRQIELGILDQNNFDQLGSNLAYRLHIFRIIGLQEATNMLMITKK